MYLQKAQKNALNSVVEISNNPTPLPLMVGGLDVRGMDRAIAAVVFAAAEIRSDNEAVFGGKRAVGKWAVGKWGVAVNRQFADRRFVVNVRSWLSSSRAEQRVDRYCSRCDSRWCSAVAAAGVSF